MKRMILKNHWKKIHINKRTKTYKPKKNTHESQTSLRRHHKDTRHREEGLKKIREERGSKQRLSSAAWRSSLIPCPWLMSRKRCLLAWKEKNIVTVLSVYLIYMIDLTMFKVTTVIRTHTSVTCREPHNRGRYRVWATRFC